MTELLGMLSRTATDRRRRFMADFEKRVSLRMDPADYEKVEAAAKAHARKPAEVLRAAIALGLEAIEKQGEKAIKRGLGADAPEA